MSGPEEEIWVLASAVRHGAFHGAAIEDWVRRWASGESIIHEMAILPSAGPQSDAEHWLYKIESAPEEVKRCERNAREAATRTPKQAAACVRMRAWDTQQSWMEGADRKKAATFTYAIRAVAALEDQVRCLTHERDVFQRMAQVGDPDQWVFDGNGDLVRIENRKPTQCEGHLGAIEEWRGRAQRLERALKELADAPATAQCLIRNTGHCDGIAPCVVCRIRSLLIESHT